MEDGSSSKMGTFTRAKCDNDSLKLRWLSPVREPSERGERRLRAREGAIPSRSVDTSVMDLQIAINTPEYTVQLYVQTAVSCMYVM